MTNEGKKKQSSYLSLLLRLGVAFFACFVIYKANHLDVFQLLDKITNGQVLLFLMLSCLVFACGLCLIGFRWWLFMRAQKIQIPVFMAIKLTFLGQFFTNFMPSAVGGDLIRAWYVSRYTDKKLQAALGVLVDRVMGLASTFILALTSYFLFMRGQGLLQVNRRSSGAIQDFFEKHPISLSHATLSILLVIGAGFILSGIFDLKSFFRKLYDHFKHVLVQFKEVMFVYYHHPMVLAFGLTVTIFLQSMVIISYWLIGRALGIEAGIQYYFVFFPMVWVVGSIPISIAGIGILEGGLVLLFRKFTGIDPGDTILIDALALNVATLALCQRLTWVFGSIPGMAVHLTGAHRQQGLSC